MDTTKQMQATELWTVVQSNGYDTLPWVGVFHSEQEAKDAIAAHYRDIFGDDEECEDVVWGEFQGWELSTTTGETRGQWADGSEEWWLIRHA